MPLLSTHILDLTGSPLSDSTNAPVPAPKRRKNNSSEDRILKKLGAIIGVDATETPKEMMIDGILKIIRAQLSLVDDLADIRRLGRDVEDLLASKITAIQLE